MPGLSRWKIPRLEWISRNIPSKRLENHLFVGGFTPHILVNHQLKINPLLAGIEE